MLPFATRRKSREAVQAAEALLPLLGLTGADLDAVQDLVRTARNRRDAGAHRDALTLATRARDLAERVVREHHAFLQARQALAAAVDRTRGIGAVAAEGKTALARVDRLAAETVSMAGIRVPNYPGAAAAARAAVQGLDRGLERYKELSDAVLSAQLALEALSEHVALAPEAGLDAQIGAWTEAVDRAAAEGRDGRSIEASLRLVRDIERQAERMGLAAQDAARRLDGLAAQLAALRSRGAVVADLEEEMGIARGLVAEGKFLRAGRHAGRTQRLARGREEAFEGARTAFKEAERAVQDLAGRGLRSDEALDSLNGARRALRHGNYVTAQGRARDAVRATRHSTNIQQELVLRIHELQLQQRALEARGDPFAADVADLVARAERDFAEGRHRRCEDHLTSASALVSAIGRSQAAEGSD